jgi:hypothetical protein
MAGKFGNSDQGNDQTWLAEKAKDIPALPPEDIAFLDQAIAQQLREEITKIAAQRWWNLFGSQGHRLDTIKDEENFIAHLDKVFSCPAASELLAPPSNERRSYSVHDVTRRGMSQRVEFSAPSASRLMELMLFGFFKYAGHWIYLFRTGDRTADGYKPPEQWWALPKTKAPSDRLGISIQIRGFRLDASVSPASAFSDLSGEQRERLAVEFGRVGTHQAWLAGIVENIMRTIVHEQSLSIQFAGEYPSGGIPLAELIANDGHMAGKKIVPINGDFFDCRPENLKTTSSRGRKMVCRICQRPTTPNKSERIKDSTGSRVRVCHACATWEHSGGLGLA